MLMMRGASRLGLTRRKINFRRDKEPLCSAHTKFNKRIVYEDRTRRAPRSLFRHSVLTLLPLIHTALIPAALMEQTGACIHPRRV